MSNMNELKTELEELRAAQAAIQSRIDLLGNMLAKVEAEPEPKSPFARVEVGEHYFLISGEGKICTNSERGDHFDGNCHAVANYCTDRDLLQQRAWHEELSRLLWRYSEEHGGDAEWDALDTHWYIYKNQSGKRLYVSYNEEYKVCGCVYFRSEETANAAIRDIVEPFLAAHPDFEW